MDILFLSSWFPYPPNNGSRIRVFNLIKQLSKNHNITLLSFAQDDFKEENIEPLRKYCKEIRTVEGRWFNPKSIKGVLGFFNLIPRSLVETHNKEMQNIFDEKVRNAKFDLILCSQISTVLYPLWFNRLPKIFEEIEVSIIKDKFKKKSIRNKLTWWKLKKFLKTVLSNFDGYTVVSYNEKDNISKINPASVIEIIPNGIDISDCNFPFNADGKDLIYTGALTYGANFDAMQYFLEKTCPLIKREIPNIKLKITGSTKGVDISKLKLDKSVELTGYIDYIKPLITNSAVCIVPLRVGGGTRVKILEAMALGTPVVATSKGAEGIEGLCPVVCDSWLVDSDSNNETRNTKNENIYIADTPEEFAKAVVELIKNGELARQMAINARKLVEERYDWNKIGEKFEKFIKKVVEKKKNALKL